MIASTYNIVFVRNKSLRVKEILNSVVSLKLLDLHIFARPFIHARLIYRSGS